MDVPREKHGPPTRVRAPPNARLSATRIVGLGLIVAAASVYLVYVLEILKFRRLDAMRLRRLRPQASPAEIELGVAQDLETGEFDAVHQTGHGEREVVRNVPGVRAQQAVGERQVDEQRVGAEDQRDHAQQPLAAERR